MNEQGHKKEFKVKISIHHKIIFYVTWLLFITVGINTYIAVRTGTKALTTELINHGWQITKDIAFGAEKAFSSLNWVFVEKMLAESVKSERNEVIFTKIIKPNCEIYMASDRSFYGDMIDQSLMVDQDTVLTNHFFPEQKEHGILLVHPITIGNEKWEVIVGLSKKPINTAFKRFIIRNTISGALVVSLGVAISFLLAKSISKPIITLTKATEEITSQRYPAHRVTVKSNDEVGILASAFNDMATKLRESYEHLEKKVQKRTAELTTANQQLTGEVTERKRAEAELKSAQEKLIETAHRAGMAEVAADVLHNVGNVLNSINVSTTVIREKVTNSELANLEKVASIINEHTDDLGTFLTGDPQGKHIPVYLTEVSKCLTDEQTDIIDKLKVLTENVQHIRDIVGMQQSYAKVSGVEVQTSLSKLAEDAIQINSSGLERHGARLIREFEELGDIEIDKQKLLQILVNLISNAKYALSGSNREEKLLTIRIYKHGEDRFRIEVADNGVGISEDNLAKIFSYGFTTKKDGHGVGLHSSALAAKEMGGTLTVYSDGLGQGATFTLELQFKPVEVMK